ncbi:hypothetical protein LINPERPRIM_LOCUS21639 [Linum perenne]
MATELVKATSSLDLYGPWIQQRLQLDIPIHGHLHSEERLRLLQPRHRRPQQIPRPESLRSQHRPRRP